jgi:iron complex outermembrane receptor protein
MSGRMVFVWLLVPLLLLLAPLSVPAAPDPSASGLLAAASPTDTPVVVNPFTVIVTAARQSIPLRLNPAATTVVDPQSLAGMPRGVAADEAFAGVPGVRIDNQADGERVHISIRGQGVLTESGIRGINVLMDGLPLNDPTGVAPDLFDVDWSTVDHVEVLRGPAGAFYGGGGSGGVINVTTREGGPGPAQGLAFGEYGSYGFYKTLAEGGGTVGTANYRVSMSHAAADGWRQHTSFWSDNIYGKLHWRPNSRVDLQQILAWTDHYEDNAEGLPRATAWTDPTQPNPDAIPKNEFYKVGRFTGGFTGRFGIAPGQALNLTGFFRTWKYLEPRPGEIIRRQFLSPGLTLQYDLDTDAGSIQNHLSVGADAKWQSVDELRFENLGRAQQGGMQSNENILQRGAGVFVLDRVGFARDWTLMLCGRYDAITNHLRDILNPGASLSKDFERATARAGLAWAPSTPLNLYANFSTGFLPPATAELLNNPDAPSGFNQKLTFATSMGEEIGARGLLPHAFSYELALFHLETKDDIGRFRLPPETLRGGIDFYHNVGNTRRFGAETRIGWTPVRQLSTEVAYTWSQFKYVSPAAIDGHWLPSSPEHILHLGADYQVVPRLSVGITSDMQSRWWVDTDGLAWVPGFALWGAHASYQWRAGGMNGDVTFAAKNIFGAFYMAFTEPDFDDSGGIVVDVWNSYQPAPPQEYFVRVSVSR